MEEEIDRRLALHKTGLWSECLGHPEDWDPVPVQEFQRRHTQFWTWVGHMIPDDEKDELFWMTEQATKKLIDN